MKAMLQMLQIDAVLVYVRALPYYDDSECTQKLSVFVDGGGAVETELARLESFRKAIIKLAEEGLQRPAGCQPTDPPFVSIDLTAGEALQKPIQDFYVNLGLERHGDVDIWVMRFRAENGQPRDPVFDDSSHALKIAKGLIDQRTAMWATCVAFQAA